MTDDWYHYTICAIHYWYFDQSIVPRFYLYISERKLRQTVIKLFDPNILLTLMKTLKAPVYTKLIFHTINTLKPRKYPMSYTWVYHAVIKPNTNLISLFLYVYIHYITLIFLYICIHIHMYIDCVDVYTFAVIHVFRVETKDDKRLRAITVTV